MKKYMQSFMKFFISEELPFTTRILNFVSFLGAIAAVIALAVQIIEGMTFITILTMFFMLLCIILVLFVSIKSQNKSQKRTSTVKAVILYGLGIIYWPIIFFTNGGPASGMAAYFTLIIILDFLLLSGKVRITALVLTSAAAIFCYAAALFWGWNTLPAKGLNNTQIFIDVIQSIFIAGFFLGAVIVFQNGVYLKEKTKAEAAGAEIRRNEELLTLVNESASLLLTAAPHKFEEALVKSMEKMALCLNIDCVYIWRADERDGIPIYILLYSWITPALEKPNHFETIYGSNIIERSDEWDNKLFSKKKYLAEHVDNFSGSIHELLSASGIKGIMAFPVSFQERYWGFVSFENRHSEKLCSEREAAILQSGSLLLANAAERNETILQLKEHLKQQQLTSSISRNFISKEPMGDLIKYALARIGIFLEVVRVLVAVFEKNSEVSRPAYFWYTDAKYAPTESQKGFSKIIKDLFPRYRDEFDDVQTIYCDNTFTYENGKFKIFHERGGLKSFICSPIYVDNELWGVMSIEEHEKFRRWKESDAILVSTVSNAISNAVARDIIEKEKAKALEQAIQASRAKGDFLSTMSHEIRTPMNAIIGMTAIGESAQTMDKKNYAFKKIDNASKHLLGIISDILDMSKIEANKLELSPVNFEFENMLQKVVNVINFRVDERRQKFYINIDNNIPQMLIGDDQRLAQVITNLLSNAVKFTPEEGTLQLNAELVSGKDSMCVLQISITDTGIGITDEQKERLFRSFEQAETGTSRKYGGTGLGLAISKRIIELMGGKIWIESEYGKGSAFYFTVNLKRSSKDKKRLLDEGINWSSLRIFAADDEPEILQFFTDVSKNLGIYCKVTTSGEEAAGHLSGNDDYDLYFIDWKLPDMNGTDLARLINARTTQKPIVIMYSSFDWSLVEDDARDAGVDKFLPKPLFQSAIINIITECLGSKITEAQIEKEKQGERKKEESMDFSNYSVLLAEDVEINREIVQELLKPTKLNVECAENGIQALRMFLEAPNKYDMIFMDIQMPEMDGCETTINIRAVDHPRAKQIPIVAMTANVFKDDIDICLKAGMNAHLGKPINFNELMIMLKMYLPKKE